MSEKVNSGKWQNLIKDFLKYAIGVILGAIGLGFSGCTLIPIFN